VEQAITPQWTVFFEYDYLSFGSAGIATPESILQVIPGRNAFRIFPTSTTNVSQNIQEGKLGVNYKFGAGDAWGPWNGVVKDMRYPVPAWWYGWDIVVGPRIWFSSGKFQWNIGAGPAGTGDISRLTYGGLTGYTGEYFQRIDSPSGLFTKGNLGLGIMNAGHQNDEDWFFFHNVPYSNTLSSTHNGWLGYGTIDFGYDVLRRDGNKFGPFVGYNFFAESWQTFGCAQIANLFSDCVPTVPTTKQIGTQDSTWQSLRVGLSGEMILADRVKLSADLAYLPYVWMIGRDNHLLRTTTTFFDQRGTGQGVQLEAIVSYYVTNNLSVGVGGRYWAMWTTNATDTCTGCGGLGIVSPSSPAAFSTERYGAFLQADYRLRP
jgi:opacity protein-like surface antigen